MSIKSSISNYVMSRLFLYNNNLINDQLFCRKVKTHPQKIYLDGKKSLNKYVSCVFIHLRSQS